MCCGLNETSATGRAHRASSQTGQTEAGDGLVTTAVLRAEFTHSAALNIAF